MTTTEAPDDWTADELDTFGGATEVQISSGRDDGTLPSYVTVWIVRVGSELYIRSAHGPQNPWYRRALARGSGRIRAAGRERDVEFERAEPQISPEIDAAYHRKYDRYGPAIVGAVVGDEVAGVTLRLRPAGG